VRRRAFRPPGVVYGYELVSDRAGPNQLGNKNESGTNQGGEGLIRGA
jgi:hypothetical protein